MIYRAITLEDVDEVRNLFWIEYSTYSGRDGILKDGVLLYNILTALNQYRKHLEENED